MLTLPCKLGDGHVGRMKAVVMIMTRRRFPSKEEKKENMRGFHPGGDHSDRHVTTVID